MSNINFNLSLKNKIKNKKPIPYLCILTLIRLDLLKRLINSINYPINNVVILFQGEFKKDEINFVNTFVKKFIYISSSINIGVSRGWNYFLKNFQSDYWLISGDDCYFEPSALKNIAEYMNSPNSQKNVLCQLKAKSNDNNNITSSPFHAFIVTKLLVKNIGLFDENIYPAYYEDLDLLYRIQLTNSKIGYINAYINSGDDKYKESCTINSVSPIYREKMMQCFKINENYYKTKWNIGKHKIRYMYPFNNPNCNITDHNIPHTNYDTNQKILLGHTNPPIFTFLNSHE